MKHPELKEDEYFIGYYSAKEYLMIGWMTKRAGFENYDSEGKKLINTYKAPVFVKKHEIKDYFEEHTESFIANLSDEEKKLNGIIVVKKSKQQ